MSAGWSPEDAERHLGSLELFGMRFGLDRMRRLTSALGRPQDSFSSIHVVGTNGKSSTVRMTAAILAEHGVRAGAYLSPHLLAWAERVRVGDADLEPSAFAAAVQRTARAAALVDRTGPAEDRVTQFELITAAAFLALAEQGVEVAVIEAGLGGRHDATNVIPSSVSALTNVGLEHTRWLGPTLLDIAREKLAVVREKSTLVVGPLSPEVAEEAGRTALARDAALVKAPADPGASVGAAGAFQRANFALARAAAQAHIGELELELGAVRAAAAAVRIPGRLEAVDARPLTLLDGAHNPAGAAALSSALFEVANGREIVAVLSVLDDKDAAGMLGELLPGCAATVLTRAGNPRALPPGTLESLARQVCGTQAPPLHVEPDPLRALALARGLAGRDGVVVATGSIYLVADLVRPSGAGAAQV